MNPLEGKKALDLMGRQVKEYGAKAFKFYNVRYDYGQPFPWRMDDPRIAYPVFEKAQELGVNLIGVHKGVPLGPQPIEHTRTFDMDGAAANFPDINFVIFHVGLPWLDEVLWQIVRFPNLYASIAATVNFIARQPRVFAEMLGKMLWWCGEDKIIYGGESPIWHPQWALEEFWNFELPRDIVEERGYPPLTEQAKRKILGENLARLHGIDVEAKKAELGVPSDLRRRAAARRGRRRDRLHRPRPRALRAPGRGRGRRRGRIEPERAREAAAGLGVPHAYGSSEEAVAADGVDVVHICTPNDLHAPLAAAALAAGKHVVCEKPLATTAAEAERVLAAADATDRVATVPFVYRYNAMVFEARGPGSRRAGSAPCASSTAATCRTGSRRPRTTTGASTRSGAARRGRSPTSARTGATSSSSSRASGSRPCARRPRPSCPSARIARTPRRSRRKIGPTHPASAGRS